MKVGEEEVGGGVGWRGCGGAGKDLQDGRGEKQGYTLVCQYQCRCVCVCVCMRVCACVHACMCEYI